MQQFVGSNLGAVICERINVDLGVQRIQAPDGTMVVATPIDMPLDQGSQGDQDR